MILVLYLDIIHLSLKSLKKSTGVNITNNNRIVNIIKIINKIFNINLIINKIVIKVIIFQKIKTQTVYILKIIIV